MKRQIHRCRDCGCETADYRCPDCWAKLRLKIGITTPEAEADPTIYTVSLSRRDMELTEEMDRIARENAPKEEDYGKACRQAGVIDLWQLRKNLFCKSQRANFLRQGMQRGGEGAHFKGGVAQATGSQKG